MKTKNVTALLLSVALFGSGVHAEDYYWSGTDGSLPLTNLSNWVDGEAVAMTEIPGRDDTLHFDIDSALSLTHVGKLKGPEFAGIVHSGDANLTLSVVKDAEDAEYLFYAPPYVRNETKKSTLTLTGPNMRVVKAGTNIVDVVHDSAAVNWRGHLQTDGGTTALVKRGKGTLECLKDWFCYWGNNDAKLIVEEGTVLFHSHGSRPWRGTQIVFSGDKPGKTVHLKWHAAGAYSNLPGEYWEQYIFNVPLKEEGVTGNDHLLTSDNGAQLVYTGAVTRLEFSGRLGGSLNVRWCPDAQEEDFVCLSGRSDTSGAFEVCRGGLVLTNAASFTELGSLTVAAGARLHVSEGCSMRTASAVFGGSELADGIYTADSLKIDGVTGGGIIAVGSARAIAVSYSQDDKTAEPADLTDIGFLNSANMAAFAPFDVALSHPIVITNGMLHATGRWEVARFRSDAALGADDFRDASPKTCGLPHTWFEMDESDGVKRLYLVARPVVSAVEVEGRTGYRMMEQPDMWSDGRLPHGGADYYCNIYYYRDGYASGEPGNVRDISDVMSKAGTEVKFAGESLTLDRSRMVIYSGAFDVDLRIYNCDSDLDDRFFATDHSKSGLRGRLYIDESCQNPFYLYSSCESYVPEKRFRITADIETGESLKLSHMWSKTPHALFSLLGDNRRVGTPVMISGAYWNTDSGTGWNNVEVTITNAVALGGPMEQCTVAGVSFNYFPKLTVDGNVVYDTHNRDWYSENSGLRLEVTEGNEFSFMRTYYCYITASETRDEIIPGCCAIEKTGGGIFALGGEITPWAGSNCANDGRDRLVRVKEGGVKPLVPEAFSNARLEFSDGTSIVVNPEKTPEWGLKLTGYAPAFAEGARVDLLAEVEDADLRGVTVPFLTVSASAPDLSAYLVPGKIKSGGAVMRGKLSRKNVVSRGMELTVYSVEYRKKGLTVILH